MSYEKIFASTLESLTQEEAEETLIKAGYSQEDECSDRDEYKVGEHYHCDQYYILHDEEDNELDIISFVMVYEKAELEEDDVFIKSYWSDLYNK